MNIVYKVIFNKSLGVFIAVSEFGKSHKKTKTLNKLTQIGLLGGSLALSSSAFSVSASSINYLDIASSGTATTAATATNSIAIGQAATVANTTSQKSIAIGFNSSVNSYDSAYTAAANRKKGQYTGVSSVAMGDSATTYGSQAVALGYAANATGWAATAIGNTAAAVGDGSIAVGNSAKTSAASYYGATYSGGAIAIGQNTASSSKAVAMGDTAYATGYRSVAIGDEAQALDTFNIDGTSFSTGIKNSVISTANSLRASYTPSGKTFNLVAGDLANDATGATAVGYRSKAIGWGATAYGMQAYALNSQTTSLGDDSKAVGYASSSLGTGAYTFGTYSAAVGTRSEAIGDKAIAVGTATSASGEGSIAAGYGVAASGTNAIAIGTATTKSKGWYTTNGGKTFNAAEHEVWNASGNYSITLGSDAVANKDYAIAIGNAAVASHERSVALGDSSSSEGAVNTSTATVNGISYGNFAGATSVGTISMGNSSNKETRQVKNVSAGEISATSTDAINGSQLYIVANELANKITNNNSYSGFSLTTSKSDGEVTGSSSQKIGSNDTITIDAGKNIKISQNGGKVSIATTENVTFNNATVTDTLKVGDVTVNQTGINAGNTVINGVADGDISPTSKQAINGSQLYAIKQEISNTINNIKDTSASASAGSDAVTVTQGSTSKVGNTEITDYVIDLSQTTKNNIQKGVDAKDIVDNQGLTFTTDNGSTNAQKLGSAVEVKGDKNIQTKASGNKVEVTLNKDIEVDSVKTGNTIMNNNGVTINNGAAGSPVSLTQNGLNNGGNRITNVAAGINDTDAVNVSQLKQVKNDVHKVDRKLRAGIAQAGAMANIPQVTRNGASGIGLGVATYRDENAVSVGYSRLSDNGKHIIKGSVSVDSRGFGMAGAGYMYQF